MQMMMMMLMIIAGKGQDIGIISQKTDIDDDHDLEVGGADEYHDLDEDDEDEYE